jgi:sarcosine oxidase subunit beta
MTSALRVAVIGAGTIGLSSALELARRGADVTVLEAESPAAGSSGLSVGVVGTQQLDPLEIALRAISVRRFRELEREGLGFAHIGYARLGRSAEVVEEFERSVATQREHGIPDARVLDRRGLQRLVPDMRVDDLEGALYGPSDGFVDGHLLCGLLAGLLAAAGGTLRTRTRLLQAARTPSGHRLVTSGAALDCDVVVNAAGAWAGRVARLLGGDLAIRPERHQAVVVELPRPLPYTMPMVMDYVPGHAGTGLNFRHEHPGQLISEIHTTGTSEPADPDDYARGIDADGLEHIAGLLLDRLPTFTDAGLGRGWAGLYPVSATGRAICGPVHGDPTVIAAAGAGGYGIQLAPALGVLAADWVLDGAPTSLPDARILAP